MIQCNDFIKEGSDNGIPPVLKTGARKGLRVRLSLPPPNFEIQISAKKYGRWKKQYLAATIAAIILYNRHHMKESERQLKHRFSFVQKFVLFIRTQGVIGLAVAVILGGAVQRVVSALVTDIINPLVGLLIGNTAGLKTATVTVGRSVFAWGDFASTVIDFLIIAFIIYILIKVIHADILDKPKDALR